MGQYQLKLVCVIEERKTRKMYLRLKDKKTGLIKQTEDASWVRKYIKFIDTHGCKAIEVYNKNRLGGGRVIRYINDLETWCRMHIRSYK